MAVALASGALAASASAAPHVSVAARGLNAPKHLTWVDGGLLIAQSGTGGPVGSSNCATGPKTEGPGTTQYCEGPTSSVGLLVGRRLSTLKGGLPSVVEEDTGEAVGVSAVAPLQQPATGQQQHAVRAKRGKGGLAILFQDELVTATGANQLTGPAATLFGTLRLAGSSAVNIARFAAQHPQAAGTLGGPPGAETAYDSDPYDVIDYGEGYAVVDAAGNSLLEVSQAGRVKLLARFPTHLEDAPAGVFGPTAVPINAQAVPTAVAVGPDGALYVSELRGVPSDPGTAYIYRVLPGHAPTLWATGLTAVTAIAFDAKGRLLATEYNTAGLLAPPTVPGALVEVSRNGKHVTKLAVSGLTAPTGVAVAPNGTVYVANNGTSSAKSSPSGEVLRITGLK